MWFSSTVFSIFLMYKVVFIPLVIEFTNVDLFTIKKLTERIFS